MFTCLPVKERFEHRSLAHREKRFGDRHAEQMEQNFKESVFTVENNQRSKNMETC